MARIFASSADHLDIALAPITAPPLTFVAWVKLAALNPLTGNVIDIGVAGSGNNRYTLRVNATSFVDFTERDTVSATVTSLLAITDTTSWHLVIGRSTDHTNRAALLDGQNKGIMSSLKAAAGLNALRIGGGLNGTTPFIGKIAWPTIYNIELTDADCAQLLLVPPTSVQATSIIGCWKLDAGASPEPDLGSSGNSLTVTGTTFDRDMPVFPTPVRLLHKQPGKRPTTYKFIQGTTAPVSAATALSGSTTTFSAGIISPNISLALTGISNSFITGNTISVLDKALAGNTASFTAGTITAAADVTIALTSQTASFTAGIPAPAINAILTGETATFIAGSLNQSSAVPLIGVSATFTAGLITIAATIPVTGNSATFTIGTLTPNIGATAQLNGQSATFTQGQLIPNSAIALTGTAATFASGILGIGSPDVIIPLSSQSATFTPGSIVASNPDITLAILGTTASFSAGILLPDGGDITIGGSNAAYPSGGWSGKFEFKKKLTKKDIPEIAQAIVEEMPFVTKSNAKHIAAQMIARHNQERFDDDEEAILLLLS